MFPNKLDAFSLDELGRPYNRNSNVKPSFKKSQSSNGANQYWNNKSLYAAVNDACVTMTHQVAVMEKQRTFIYILQIHSTALQANNEMK